jgi:hypothetical protein
LTLSTNDSSSPLAGSVRVRKAWCGRFAVFPSTVVRSTFSESVAPRVTVFESGDVALSLGELVYTSNTANTCRAHLFFAAPPTPAPLLAIATVASSKLHAAADAIDAPESSSEDTRPKESFIIDVCRKVNAELSSDARGQLSCVASRARAASVIGWPAASCMRHCNSLVDLQTTACQYRTPTQVSFKADDLIFRSSQGNTRSTQHPLRRTAGCTACRQDASAGLPCSDISY